tara:strand:- start:442 stop:789 length:348 start_codon:yes stop_codon:yes gene_type:complete
MDINYKGGWKLDIRHYSEGKWDTLVKILEGFGVKVYCSNYESEWVYLAVSSDCHGLNRYDLGSSSLKDARSVDILTMVHMLTTPAKSEHEIKIDKLQATIDDAAKQILELKQVQK